MLNLTDNDAGVELIYAGKQEATKTYFGGYHTLP
jgi:hypothetical protein